LEVSVNRGNSKAWPFLALLLAACGSGGNASDAVLTDVPLEVVPKDTGTDQAIPDIGGRDVPADAPTQDKMDDDLSSDVRLDLSADTAFADAVGDTVTDGIQADPASDGLTDTPPVDVPFDSTAVDAFFDVPALDVAIDVTSPSDTLADTPADDWISLFDPQRIRDRATADCQFTNQHTVLKDNVLLDAWDVSYLSWESVDGHLRSIRIRGFAARPAGSSGRLPGVVQAHGLGGMSQEAHATGTAALLGAFVIAFTGPGGGDVPLNTSEGLPAGDGNGYRMFDTLDDPRGSWFWGHAVAGLRGLTCLEGRDDVDAGRLGMTGFSAGGVVTLIGAAVDDRIRAAVPLSSCGAWDVATVSPKAWQHELLTKAGLTTASPEWSALMANLDSAHLLPATTAQILMVNGSADEFFPLTAHVATFDAIPGDAKRTAIAGNFDHGCFQLTSIEDKDDVEIRASVAAKGGQRMWFRHVFGMDPRYAYVPLPPSNLTFLPGGGPSAALVQVDQGGSTLDVSEVRLWASADAKVWASLQLESKGNSLYGTKNTEFVPQDPGTLVYYVDVVYTTKDLLFPETFSISSRPVLPAGFVPDIRGITSCW
jgi:cephalosporin-C deacetylase-like acetyl esterase